MMGGGWLGLVVWVGEDGGLGVVGLVSGWLRWRFELEEVVFGFGSDWKRWCVGFGSDGGLWQELGA